MFDLERCDNLDVPQSVRWLPRTPRTRTNGQMTPMQSIIDAKVSEMQAAVPSAGARVLALLISLEHPNPKATHQRTSYHWESASDQDQDNERINRHTQQAHATNRSVHANAVNHLPASLRTRVLVLRVPVHFVLLFAFASLSS